jgi:hypothetical protein
MHKGRLIRCAPPAEIKGEMNAATLEDAFIAWIGKVTQEQRHGG